ncbi:MAG: hypothetical protein U0871_26795 [Gemmataceae bacterium]
MPKDEWPTPEAAAELVGDLTGPRRSARLRAVNCDLCADSWTGPRCVYACPHDAAHRLPGERVLELAERRQRPAPPGGFLATLARLLRGPAKGE